MKKWLLCGVMVLSICSVNSHASLEQYSVNNVKLVLDTEHCLLKANNSILPLGMGANCFFIRQGKSKKIDSHFYQDSNSRMLLVVGTPSTKKNTVKVDLARQGCGTQIRGVIITGDQVVLSSKILPDSLTCASEGVESSVFDQLFE